VGRSRAYGQSCILSRCSQRVRVPHRRTNRSLQSYSTIRRRSTEPYRCATIRRNTNPHLRWAWSLSAEQRLKAMTRDVWARSNWECHEDQSRWFRLRMEQSWFWLGWEGACSKEKVREIAGWKKIRKLWMARVRWERLRFVLLMRRLRGRLTMAAQAQLEQQVSQC